MSTKIEIARAKPRVTIQLSEILTVALNVYASNAFDPGLKGVSENSWRHLQAFSKELVLKNIP